MDAAEGFWQAVRYLPPRLREGMREVPHAVRRVAQEIRLRAGAAVMLSLPEGLRTVMVGGERLLCDAADVRICFESLCEDSVHTHQEEIRRGFISTAGGCRAGIAGTVVSEGGVVTSMRDVTSVCLRIARRHDGCAEGLARELFPEGRITSVVLCGEPSSGKTSLLRDLARLFSEGTLGRRVRVAVVDERGELAGAGGLADCDVLRYCPKAAGIEQAVRTLAPEVVVFDELGGEAEIAAVMDGLHGGVAAVTTVHARDEAALLRRCATAAAIRGGAFERVVMLAGRHQPGRVRRVHIL